MTYPASGTLRDGLWIKQKPSKYSPSQISQYLSTVGYTPYYDAKAIESGSFPINLETLERVMRLHILTFPWENTAMHYTSKHDMDVTAEGLFPRFVNDKMGSYCFGQNGLLLEILRGLGFKAYGVGARITLVAAGSPQLHCANTHLVIFVQPLEGSNQTYLVDTGIGVSNLMRPLLLSTDPKNIVYGMTETERHRLIFKPIPESSLATSSDLSTTAYGQWSLEVGHRSSPNSQEEKWSQQYVFAESEIWQHDMLFSSFAICQRPNPQGLFWNNVLCVRLYTIDEGNEEIEKSKRPMYRMILHGKELKKSFGATSELVATFQNEVDRIRALREVFGMAVKDEDEVHILGRAAALQA